MSIPILNAKASFALRGHNPDVLTCIANLSNDEVFTPPELANQMLDTLEVAWAESNAGASIWADSTVTFLDPFTKSGVFLREIVSRLTVGLAKEIPELTERVDHILTKQVYGIGITRLTSLLARRSVYCSKDATSEHSIAQTFDRDWGNIWFERTEHTWSGGNYGNLLDAGGIPALVGRRCKFCGAQEDRFDRDEALETHAYAFIHTDNIKARLAELFGATMQFDVVIGNPPYQMTGAAGGTSDASIYHLFVEQAHRLAPQFLVMVTPSRWLAGGRGMDEFRTMMLGDRQLRNLVDFPTSAEIFPGVELKGGVSYFLWDGNYQGKCKVKTIRGGVELDSIRDLGEFDVFVRDPRAVDILKKVALASEISIVTLLSRDTPFGLASNFADFEPNARDGFVPLYYIRRMKRAVGFIDAAKVTKNKALIEAWKVLVPEAYNGGDGLPHQIVGKPCTAPSPSVCTQSYLFFECGSETEAESLQSYYTTRFFRFLVSLRKITQHAIHSTYSWVPVQPWDRTWTDEQLFKKYNLTDEDRAYIESQIKPMNLEILSTDA